MKYIHVALYKLKTIITLLILHGKLQLTLFRNNYVNGMKVEGWAILDLCRLNDNEYSEILNSFQRVGKEVGL